METNHAWNASTSYQNHEFNPPAMVVHFLDYPYLFICTSDKQVGKQQISLKHPLLLSSLACGIQRSSLGSTRGLHIHYTTC
jgi:hypothetical protein